MFGRRKKQGQEATELDYRLRAIANEDAQMEYDYVAMRWAQLEEANADGNYKLWAQIYLWLCHRYPEAGLTYIEMEKQRYAPSKFLG